MAAWECSDVPAILELLVADARFTMPPLAAWFGGHADIGRFLAERVFATPWLLVPTTVNGQLAFACYQATAADGEFRLGSLMVLTLRGARIVEMTCFLDPATQDLVGLAREWPG